MARDWVTPSISDYKLSYPSGISDTISYEGMVNFSIQEIAKNIGRTFTKELATELSKVYRQTFLGFVSAMQVYKLQSGWRKVTKRFYGVKLPPTYPTETGIESGYLGRSVTFVQQGKKFNYVQMPRLFEYYNIVKERTIKLGYWRSTGTKNHLPVFEPNRNIENYRNFQEWFRQKYHGPMGIGEGMWMPLPTAKSQGLSLIRFHNKGVGFLSEALLTSSDIDRVNKDVQSRVGDRMSGLHIYKRKTKMHMKYNEKTGKTTTRKMLRDTTFHSHVPVVRGEAERSSIRREYNIYMAKLSGHQWW